MAQEKSILFLPGSCYDFDDRHFRIGFGRANFPEALGRWEEYLAVNR